MLQFYCRLSMVSLDPLLSHPWCTATACSGRRRPLHRGRLPAVFYLNLLRAKPFRPGHDAVANPSFGLGHLSDSCAAAPPRRLWIPPRTNASRCFPLRRPQTLPRPPVLLLLFATSLPFGLAWPCGGRRRCSMVLLPARRALQRHSRLLFAALLLWPNPFELLQVMPQARLSR